MRPASLAGMAALVLGMAWGGTGNAWAAGINASGTISTNTVWGVAQSPVSVQGDLILDQDATLTIEPGVEVRMGAAASFTLRQGALHAVGTVGQPIRITSAHASPAPGNWGTWRFLAGTRSAQTTLEHVRIEYGSGMVIEKASPQLNHVAINHHNGPAVAIDLESSPAGQGLSATGNAFNAVVVPSGILRGQVVWGLTGIPYLVRQGVVEVGQAALAIEPANIKTAQGWVESMRVTLGAPAPAGGRVINLSSSPSYIASFNSSVAVPEGATSADFEFRAQSQGKALLTASHPDLGSAQARIEVIYLPQLVLSAPYSMGLQMPYSVALRLPQAAPAGGVMVQLRSTPAGALQLPVSVTVPEGQQESAFTVKGLLAGTSVLSAQAVGYGASAVNLTVQPMALRYSVQTTARPLVAGQERELIVSADSPAPQGGLKVKLVSSDPGVVGVSFAEVTIPEGQTYASQYPMLIGVAKGQAQVRLSADGATDAIASVTVRSPTVLKLDPGTDDGKVWLGRQMQIDKGLWVVRQADGEDLYDQEEMQVQLRCVADTVCSVSQGVTIPWRQARVQISATGLALGETQIEAKADEVQPVSIPVQVVEPQIVFQDYWGSHGDSPLSGHRFISERQPFRLCIGVPGAASSTRQLTTETFVFGVGLYDQVPSGVVSAIYDQATGGAQVVQAQIETGQACSEARYVGEATQRGQYRIGADTPGRFSVRSQLQVIHPDDEIAFFPTCSDCQDIAVVSGFATRIDARPLHMGGVAALATPLQVQVRCANPSVCTAPSEVELPASEVSSVTFELIGGAPGSTDIEAVVPSAPGTYPETYRTSVLVTVPKLEIGNSDVQVGARSELALCIGEWNARSYPISPLSVSLSSANPGVLQLVESSVEWPAGESCIYPEFIGVSLGSTSVMVTVPGIAPQVVPVEVRNAD